MTPVGPGRPAGKADAMTGCRRGRRSHLEPRDVVFVGGERQDPRGRCCRRSGGVAEFAHEGAAFAGRVRGIGAWWWR